jgi:Cu/Ag efflux protein CusF
MRKAVVLCTAALAALALVAPAFAQGTAPAATTTAPPTTPPTRATAPAPVASPATPSVKVTRHLTGEVVAVNPDAKTLTVKRHAWGRKLTFAVEGDAAAQLGDLKTGDKVTIGYGRAHRQLVAGDIVKSQAAPAK